MPLARFTFTLALAVALTPLALAQENGADSGADGDERVLPTPGLDVPVFEVEASVGSGPRVLLTWSPQPEASDYVVFVNAEAEPQPKWQRVNGSLEVDEGAGNVTFVDRSPPEPQEGRTEISYAVVAVNDAGEIVGEGRAAADVNEANVPYRPGFDEEEESLQPVTTTGTLIGAIALAALAIGALAWIGIRRGRE